MADRIEGTYHVALAEQEQNLLFGWANIAVTSDGQAVVDSQSHVIEPAELELAAYDFVLNHRVSGEDHDAEYGADGLLVESMFFGEDKLIALATNGATGEVDEEALAVLKRTIPTGWWVGFHLPDDAAFERARTSKSMFSIEGSAVHEEAA